MSAREDELVKTMISCSDKRKAVSENRKLETLEAVNDSKLYRSLGGHKKYKSNRGDEEEVRGEEEKVGVKSEKEVGKLEEAMLGFTDVRSATRPSQLGKRWLGAHELPSGGSVVDLVLGRGGRQRPPCHRLRPQ